MKNCSLIRSVACLLAAAVLANVAGCSMGEEKKKVSENLAELRKIVELPAAVKSARWEIFGTPEYTGGVPGPTDMVTLVAELDPFVHEVLLRGAAKKGSAFVAPEAARPWLTRDFQNLLAASKNSSLSISYAEGCSPYRTRLAKTGVPVDGFICPGDKGMLLYLTLSSSVP